MNFSFLNFATKIKKFLWPINKGEYKKFLSMFFIFFCISFNYNILRAAKDTLIVTSPNSGAETIAFIKTWIMLPAAIIITFIFTKISQKFSRNKVFHIMVWMFISFFILFTFFLYPNKNMLHLNGVAEKLSSFFPKGLNGLIALIRNWTYTLFYVMSELWGAVILSVVFWGNANEITTLDQAKRFYSLFGVGANIATILAGRATMYLSSNIFISKIPYGKIAWDQSILFLTIAVTVVGALMSLIFHYLNKSLPTEVPVHENKPTKKKKKISIKESFSYLAKSKYLIYIALIVLCYNITINLVEIVWKNQVKQLYPSSSDYNYYMGQVMILLGILSTFVAFFISGNFLRKFSWTFNALLSPIIILITGGIFFSFFIYKGEGMSTLAALLGTTPLALSVLFGTTQNCFARSMKYTLFDATKEIAYIPLDKETRIKGKAAIDGVGSRIGKSGGSVIHQSLLVVFSSLAISAPYIGFIFFGIVVVWLFSVKALGKEFKKLTTTKTEEKAEDTEQLEDAKNSLTEMQKKSTEELSTINSSK